MRPTARRLREALFEIIGPRVEGARFLDLCAGSGAVGIEALSRGAAHVTFVDRSSRMCSFVELNLGLCGVPRDQTEVFLSDALEFLRRAVERGCKAWDVAFFDPPYAGDYLPVLKTFGASAVLKRAHGLLVVEHHHENQLKDAVGQMRRQHVLQQGSSCLSFYEFDGSQKISATPLLNYPCE